MPIMFLIVGPLHTDYKFPMVGYTIKFPQWCLAHIKFPVQQYYGLLYILYSCLVYSTVHFLQLMEMVAQDRFLPMCTYTVKFLTEGTSYSTVLIVGSAVNTLSFFIAGSLRTTLLVVGSNCNSKHTKLLTEHSTVHTQPHKLGLLYCAYPLVSVKSVSLTNYKMAHN